MRKIAGVLLILASTATLLFAQNNTNVSGLVFYQYAISDGGSKSGEFEINRAYLTVSRNLSDELSVKFQTDVGRMKNDPSNPHLFVYLKNAKVDYKVGQGILTLGLQGMNMFSVQEKSWDYRHIEKSAMDKYGFSSSADLGIGYSAKLMGKLNTSVLLTNGAGYKKPENDDYKKLSLQAYLGDGKISKDRSFNIGGVMSYEKYDVNADTVGSVTVLGGFAAGVMGPVKFGAEIDTKIDSEVEDNELIISTYGDFTVMENLKVFGRFDRAGSVDNFSNYVIAGVKYTPAKGLDISPNVKIMDDVDPTYALNFQVKF